MMSTAKSLVIDKINMISDEITDEMQIVEQLYILMKLEHSKKRCEEEGTLSTEEVRKHFEEKRRNYAGV